MSHLRLFLDATADLVPTTLARRMAALRSCFGWAYRENLLPADPTAKLEAIPIGKRHPSPLTENQVEAILDAIPPQDLRNRLLLTLLYETGMHVEEALDLQVQQVHLGDLDGSYLRVVGKKVNKERVIPLIDASRSVVLLREVLKTLNGVGPLFRGDVSKGGRQGEAITYSTIWYHFERYVDQARSTHPEHFVDEHEPITIHRLRHTYATMKLRDGVSFLSVSQLLGHTNPQMTLRYARTDNVGQRQSIFQRSSSTSYVALRRNSMVANEPLRLHRVFSVKAVYRDPGPACYRGNPLNEALPPIYTEKQAVRLLQYTPGYEESYRQLPLEHRLHLIADAVRFIQPLSMHLRLEQCFSRMIRSGYVGRDPSVPKFQALYRRLQAIGDEPIELPPPILTTRGCSIVGHSGAGKSTAVNRILSMYPQVIFHGCYKGRPFTHSQLVYIKLECPHDGLLSGLCKSFFTEVDRLLDTNTYERYVQHGKPKIDDLLLSMAKLAFRHSISVLVLVQVSTAKWIERPERRFRDKRPVYL